MANKQVLQSAGDGTAVPVGYVGEKITWISAPSTVALSISEADWTNASITFGAGVWLICANILTSATPNNVAGSNATAVVRITDSSNNIIQTMDKQLFITTPTNGVAGIVTTLSFSLIANVNGSTTYKIRAFKAEASATCNLYNQAFARSEFFAVRIA